MYTLLDTDPASPCICRTTLNPLGKHVMDGKEIDLPPVVLGTYGNDPAKKTILVYGHYDVQPALKEDVSRV